MLLFQIASKALLRSRKQGQLSVGIVFASLEGIPHFAASRDYFRSSSTSSSGNAPSPHGNAYACRSVATLPHCNQHTSRRPALKMAPTKRKALGNHPHEVKRRRSMANKNDSALRQSAPVANGRRKGSSPELESSSSSSSGEDRESEGTESESSKEQTRSKSSSGGEESDDNGVQSSKETMSGDVSGASSSGDEEEAMATSESEEEGKSSGAPSCVAV